jgi:hypothetical protein
MDKLSIEYVVDKAGWAEARISNGKDKAIITVSYLHDSLLELAQMAVSLRNGVKETKVLFMDEPGEHQFIVSTEGNEASYEVRWYSDWESWGFRKKSEFKLVLKGIAPVQRIVQQITQALWHIHEEIGPVKYKELWVEHEFPEKQFKELANA